MIDPANGDLLSDENITVTPLLGLPPGSVLTCNERVSSGWTNTAPHEPTR